MSLFYIILTWWISGVVFTVIEIRKEEDVTVGYLILSCFVGFIGPFIYLIAHGDDLGNWIGEKVVIKKRRAG